MGKWQILGFLTIVTEFEGVLKVRDPFLGVPENDDQSILGSILGVPLVWETTI